MNLSKETDPYFGILDLRELYDEVEHAKLLLETLKDRNVYRPDLLYTGIFGVPWANIKQYGADKPKRRTTYCHEEADLVNPSGGD